MYVVLHHGVYACSQVFTWGHRLVTPRRVVIARNIRKLGNTPLKFHQKERLHVVDIAAGVTHSMALTDDGALFYWVSSDPDLRCQQVFIYGFNYAYSGLLPLFLKHEKVFCSFQ